MTDIPPPPPPPGAQPPASASPDAGAALSYGWNKFQQNVGPLIGVILIPIAAQLVLQFIGYATQSLFIILLLTVLSLVVSLALQIGIYNAVLMITRGESVDVGKAFSSDRWGEWIVFALVFGLFVGVGALFCGIGALVVLAFWGFAPYYFIDQRMSLGQAFSASLEKTRSTNGLPIAIVLCVLVGVAGIIVCYIGALVTMPLAYTAVGFLYRQTNNQPVAP